ncbi:hypothetical protein AB0I84_34010 [Streptomyces spectabilis]|uniref:hypothetical protein n=1 Tax=Streptomyces spectabilis TaxID=68270 RepID=UPI0033E33C81
MTTSDIAAAPANRRATLRRRGAALGLLALTLTATATLGSTPAEAATSRASKKCDYGPANCKLKKYHPRKGTVKVKVDNSGKRNQVYMWDIRHNGRIVCMGEVREKWKAKKFTCKNMPKGKLVLGMPYRKSTKISMSW